MDNLILLQIESLRELAECLPTPSIWHKAIDSAVLEYNSGFAINSDTGVNYLKSDLKGLVGRITAFAKKAKLPESMIISPRDIPSETIKILSLDDIELLVSDTIKVFPAQLIEKILDSQERIDILPKYSVILNDICTICSGILVPDYDTGCVSCASCGQCIESSILMFVEDRNITSNDSSKSKSNSYKTAKHFETWMNRILAIEVKPDAITIVPKIRRHFRSLGVPKDLIDYCGIRDFLKKNKMTGYYESISWLLKEVTGRLPPDLTESERMDIAYRFEMIIDTFDRLRIISDAGPTGRTYYPFFIYKIIQTKFANKPDKLRLLDYIHIQQEKTLMKNEHIYNRIILESNNPRLTKKDAIND